MSKFVTSRNYFTEATTTSPGTIQIATQAEVDAGLDCNKAVVPCTLNMYITDPQGASQATTANNGTVELATDAETIAGLLTTHAVTPAGLSAALTAASAFGTQLNSAQTAGPIASGGATEPTYATATSFTTGAALPAGDYIYFASVQINSSIANKDVAVIVEHDQAGAPPAVIIERAAKQTHSASAAARMPFALIGRVTLLNDIYTFRIGFARASYDGGAAPTLNAYNSHLHLWRVA